MRNSHASGGIRGVGPAERTGKSLVRYWPGGSCPLLSRFRPLKPRVNIFIGTSCNDQPGSNLNVAPCRGCGQGGSGSVISELMRRLGYTRYVAQGGDVGALVTDLMGRQAVEGLVGYHLNLLTAVLAIVDHLPRESEQERAAAAAVATFRQDGFGYFLEMATRPQTISYSLLESPVGLAAWLLDH